MTDLMMELTWRHQWWRDNAYRPTVVLVVGEQHIIYRPYVYTYCVYRYYLVALFIYTCMWIYLSYRYISHLKYCSSCLPVAMTLLTSSSVQAMVDPCDRYINLGNPKRTIHNTLRDDDHPICDVNVVVTGGTLTDYHIVKLNIYNTSKYM